MIKRASFAVAALLPMAVVLGRGDDSGRDEANAREDMILSQGRYQMRIYYWNTLDENDDLVFNGKIRLEGNEDILDPDTTWDFGFCIEVDVDQPGYWGCYQNGAEPLQGTTDCIAVE